MGSYWNAMSRKPTSRAISRRTFSARRSPSGSPSTKWTGRPWTTASKVVPACSSARAFTMAM